MSRTQYRVTVSNIGEVYAGGNTRAALAEFNHYKRASLDGRGRASAESVTLWTDGEPAREFEPVVYDCELTDTYAGEANYSWVKRATLIYKDQPTDRKLTQDAKRVLGLTAHRCRRDDCQDTIQLDPIGWCQRAFITRRDV